ncbi:MAG: iron ABC transporter permease [Candidatus Kapaibacterium sp.]|nr:MAG: iron ABC transporter permease [Candidatus Kapabacteria bacterium]
MNSSESLTERYVKSYAESITVSFPAAPPRPEKLEGKSLRQNRHAKAVLACTALAVVLVVVAILACGIGAVKIPALHVLSILAAQCGFPAFAEVSEQQANILLLIRLPRVLLAVIVGGGLGVAGAAVQGLFRNPLADPALVGISSGATVGAVTFIGFGGALPFAGVWLREHPLWNVFGLQIMAFASGFVAVWLVYRIATRYGTTSIAAMLLAGVAVTAIAEAYTGYIIFTANDAQLRNINFWRLGSLGAASWQSLAVLSALVIPSTLAVMRFATPLNALLLGERDAENVGVNVQLLKRVLLVLTALIVGASVSLCGIIWFVGLITPHLLRLVIGPNHRFLLPSSALAGASLLVVADLIARTIAAPAELPIGIVTAALGAPVFVWLLVREQRKHGLMM